MDQPVDEQPAAGPSQLKWRAKKVSHRSGKPYERPSASLQQQPQLVPQQSIVDRITSTVSSIIPSWIRGAASNFLIPIEEDQVISRSDIREEEEEYDDDEVEVIESENISPNDEVPNPAKHYPRFNSSTSDGPPLSTDLTGNHLTADRSISEPQSPFDPAARSRYPVTSTARKTKITSSTASRLGKKLAQSKIRMQQQVDLEFDELPDEAGPSHPVVGRGSPNEDDDRSSTSENTASSTSGCSSLVPSHQQDTQQSQLHQTRIQFPKDSLERLRIELMKKKQSTSAKTSIQSFDGPCSRPSSSTSNTNPLINQSAATPNMWLHSSANRMGNVTAGTGFPVSFARTGSTLTTSGRSPFYDGRTTYGGSSARRAARLMNSNPYSRGVRIPPVLHVRVSDRSTSSSQENLSEAARKILQTMSSPLQDAKKIPLSESHGLSNRSVHQLYNRPLSGPNSSGISNSVVNRANPPLAAASVKDHSHRMNWPIDLKDFVDKNKKFIDGQNSSSQSRETVDVAEDSVPHTSSRAPATDARVPVPVPSIFSSSPITPSHGRDTCAGMPDISFKKKADEISRSNVVDDLCRGSVPLSTPRGTVSDFGNALSAGGKMKSSLSSARISTRDVCDSGETLATLSQASGLPDVPLPVPQNLPKFNFSIGPSATIKSDAGPSKQSSLVATAAQPAFVDEFPFSSPASSSTPTSSSPAAVAAETPVTKSPVPADPVVGLPPDVHRKPASPSNVKQFKLSAPAPGSWNCPICLITNSPEKTACAACDSMKPNPQQKATPDKAKQSPLTLPPPPPQQQLAEVMPPFKLPAPAPGSWNCPECLITNSSEKTACAACESLKPGSNQKASPEKTTPQPPLQSLPDMTPSFKLSAPFSAVPVAAPDVHKEPASAPVAKPFKFSAPAPGSWNCTVCLITNSADRTACAACETIKPNQQKASPEKDTVTAPPQATFTFSAAKPNPAPVPTFGTTGFVSQSPFVFGGTSSFSTPTSSSLTPTTAATPAGFVSQSPFVFGGTSSFSTPTSSFLTPTTAATPAALQTPKPPSTPASTASVTTPAVPSFGAGFGTSSMTGFGTGSGISFGTGSGTSTGTATGIGFGIGTGTSFGASFGTNSGTGSGTVPGKQSTFVFGGSSPLSTPSLSFGAPSAPSTPASAAPQTPQPSSALLATSAKTPAAPAFDAGAVNQSPFVFGAMSSFPTPAASTFNFTPGTPTVFGAASNVNTMDSASTSERKFRKAKRRLRQ